MVKGAPDYDGISKRVMRPDIYTEAMKELGVKVSTAEEQKCTLFDSVLDGKDPEKYAKSFSVNSLAG
jgi:nitrate/nitrite transport system substrate-binding protein